MRSRASSVLGVARTTSREKPYSSRPGSASSEYDLLGTYIYKLGVGGLNYGQGAAMAIFVLALTLVLSWFYIRRILQEDEL